MNVLLHTDPMTSVILWGTVLLIFGLVGRYLAQKLHQPGVLGELLMGVCLGNCFYFFGMPLAIVLRDSAAIFQIVTQLLQQTSLTDAVHMIVTQADAAKSLLNVLQGQNGGEWVKVTYIVDIFSRYGIIFLLFMVGLESSVAELKHTGAASLRVAIVGVVAPLLLGLLALSVFMPDLSFASMLFIAATLAATSVGITARVLKDIRALHTREAKTILGAAMLDDVLGLLLLAIVSGVVLSGHVDGLVVLKLLSYATIFLLAAFWFGPSLLRIIIHALRFTEPWEAKLLATILFVMLLAWFAAMANLATMIGAFIAGMVMHDAFFAASDHGQASPLGIKQLIAPFEAIYAPLFFLLIGIQVKLESLFSLHTLMITAILTIVAIIGKLISGIVAAKRDDKWLIGIGMLPRGEVGLVFAAMGKSMGVISDALFSAIIAMVMITTIIVPPWIKARYASNHNSI